jgi:ribosomal protein L34
MAKLISEQFDYWTVRNMRNCFSVEGSSVRDSSSEKVKQKRTPGWADRMMQASGGFVITGRNLRRFSSEELARQRAEQQSQEATTSGSKAAPSRRSRSETEGAE